MLWSPLIQRSLCFLTELGVPDLIAGDSQSAAELAAQTGTHESSLYRVLRTLSSAGVFAETPDHRFKLTPISQLLRSDAPGSTQDLAIMLGTSWQWRNWGEFKDCVTTGVAAQERVFGMGTFELFAKEPALGAIFNRAMTALSAAVAPTIAAAYDFSPIRVHRRACRRPWIAPRCHAEEEPADAGYPV